MPEFCSVLASGANKPHARVTTNTRKIARYRVILFMIFMSISSLLARFIDMPDIRYSRFQQANESFHGGRVHTPVNDEPQTASD